MQATVLYVSLMATAWYQGATSLFADSGFLPLAIPVLWVVVGVVVDDAYAGAKKRSIFAKMRGPVLGLGLAYLSQFVLSAGVGNLALPKPTMFYGGMVGLLFVIAVRLLFPGVTDRQAGAGATVPALWLKWSAEPIRITPAVRWIVKDLAIVLIVALVADLIVGSALSGYLAMISVMILIFREVRRRW